MKKLNLKNKLFQFNLASIPVEFEMIPIESETIAVESINESRLKSTIPIESINDFNLV